MATVCTEAVSKMPLRLPCQLPEPVMERAPSTALDTASETVEDQATLFRRWTVDGTPMGSERELVPGLRSALREARLSSYSDAVEKWCLENGAAFVGEVLEELEALADEVLRPGTADGQSAEAHLRQLRAALFAHAADATATASTPSGGGRCQWPAQHQQQASPTSASALSRARSSTLGSGSASALGCVMEDGSEKGEAETAESGKARLQPSLSRRW
mmetsp:Transcript_73559/g.204394  ORF Transcript_73559/g.204394 Transcript_73559/m.204394 type:complete len:217 (-) Transcript_73559:120-770(-)